MTKPEVRKGTIGVAHADRSGCIGVRSRGDDRERDAGVDRDAAGAFVRVLLVAAIAGTGGEASLLDCVTQRGRDRRHDPAAMLRIDVDE